MTSVTEEMIEAAASAAFRAAQTEYRAEYDHYPITKTWVTTEEKVRAGWRDIARAALEAALSASPAAQTKLTDDALFAFLTREGWTYPNGAVKEDATGATLVALLRAFAASLAPSAPQPTEPVAVKLKPLEWHELTSAREDGPPEPTGDWEATSVIGGYWVQFFEDHYEVTDPEGEYVERWCGEASEAKAAAQADYSKRILSALASPVAQQRDEVIEALEAWCALDRADEAFRECCERADAEGWSNDPTGSMHVRSAAEAALKAHARAVELRDAALRVLSPERKDQSNG